MADGQDAGSDRKGLDLAHLRGWIGRTEHQTDTVTPRLVGEFRATLDELAEAPGEAAPLAIHWCLAPPAAAMSALGPDGHPARGGFLPPVDLPRRMWAGGALKLHDALQIGDLVERRSRVAEVTVKAGRGGPLCFVTVEHELSTARGPAITERQDIVYLNPPPVGAAPPAAPSPAPPARHRLALTADPVRLFRYSAITFNGHRIHYDRTYATEAEGYRGLVVHGPLQASLLLAYAARIHGAPPRRFSFRGLRPLFDSQPFELTAEPDGDHLDLGVVDHAGGRTMSGRAEW